jgi:phosphate uptake regulator
VTILILILKSINNFSSLLPTDSTNKRDTAQGIEIKIIVTLHGASAISKFEAAERLKNLKLFIQSIEYQADNEGTKTVTLHKPDYYADFVKLAFIMKHPRVANRVEDKDKFPKIVDKIYENSCYGS